jgi:SAM-dependent methyltransferase
MSQDQFSEFFRFHEFDIPVPLVNLTGGGPDNFGIISSMHISNLRRFIGIEPDDRFLEIGCGIGRDAIPLTKILSSEGSYMGIDIIRPSIDFCVSNITRAYPNFSFVHFDVQDQLHNNAGTGEMVEFTIPSPDAFFDKAIAWSVFTHMWEKDIRHYLGELYRVLKSGGLAYLTCFVLTPEVVAKARETNLTKFDLRFEHQIEDGCYVNDPIHPLGAIGYSPERLRAMVIDSGLEFSGDMLLGAWSGYHASPHDGQDVLVLRRP